MPMAAFDTISVAKRLQEEFGMPEKQAEGVAVVLHENFVGNVATKEDLRRGVKELTGQIKGLDDKIDALGREVNGQIKGLDDKIKGLDDKMATKEEVAHISTDLKWIKVIGGVIVAVLVLPWFRDLALVFVN